MQLIEVSVEIRARDGHKGGRGRVAFATPSFGHRLVRAGALALAGAGIGALLLPIPLIHLFGIMFFLGMCGLAAKRLATRRVLRSASGRCPSCGTDQGFFVGLGGRRVRFPVTTTCPACHVGLDLFPMQAGTV